VNRRRQPPGQPRTLAVHLAVNPFRGISSLASLSPVFHGGYDMFKNVDPDRIRHIEDPEKQEPMYDPVKLAT
jgi:hypothetical protein